MPDDSAPQFTIDYLGRLVPISMSNTVGLPVGGPPNTAAPPGSPSGLGITPGARSAVGTSDAPAAPAAAPAAPSSFVPRPTNRPPAELEPPKVTQQQTRADARPLESPRGGGSGFNVVPLAVSAARAAARRLTSDETGQLRSAPEPPGLDTTRIFLRGDALPDIDPVAATAAAQAWGVPSWESGALTMTPPVEGPMGLSEGAISEIARNAWGEAGTLASTEGGLGGLGEMLSGALGSAAEVVPYAGAIAGFVNAIASGGDPARAAAQAAIQAGLIAATGAAAPVIGFMFAPAIRDLLQQIFGGQTVHDYNRIMAGHEQSRMTGAVRDRFANATPPALNAILASEMPGGYDGSGARIGDALGLFVGRNVPGSEHYSTERGYNPEFAALERALPELGYTTTDYSREPTGRFTGGIGYTSGTGYDEWAGFAHQAATLLEAGQPELWQRVMDAGKGDAAAGEAVAQTRAAETDRLMREQAARDSAQGGD